MDCMECGVVTDAEQFLFCYDCATKLDKCLHCGGDGNYAGCLTCEGCIVKNNGRCKCGSPKKLRTWNALISWRLADTATVDVMPDFSIVRGLWARRESSMNGIERETMLCDAVVWRMNKSTDSQKIDELRKEIHRRREQIKTSEADVAETDRMVQEYGSTHG